MVDMACRIYLLRLLMFPSASGRSQESNAGSIQGQLLIGDTMTMIRVNVGCGQTPTKGFRNFDNSKLKKIARRIVDPVPTDSAA